MTLLDEVKLSLGISSSAKDADIQNTIDAAASDMRLGGAAAPLANEEDADPLLKQAIKMYCRAWYNYQGQGERWTSAYEALRNGIALSGLYE